MRSSSWVDPEVAPLIHKPRELYIDNGIGSLSSLEIVDADGVKQIVKLKDPLMLPPPGR